MRLDFALFNTIGTILFNTVCSKASNVLALSIFIKKEKPTLTTSKIAVNVSLDDPRSDTYLWSVSSDF